MGFVLGMQPAPGRVSCRTPLGAGWHQGGAQVATSGWLTKACSEGDTYQPPLERDGVDAEVPDQAEVVVHVLQAAQHLWGREQSMAPAHRPAATAVPGEVHGASQAAAPGPCPREPPPPRGPRKHSLVLPTRKWGFESAVGVQKPTGLCARGRGGCPRGALFISAPETQPPWVSVSARPGDAAPPHADLGAASERKGPSFPCLSPGTAGSDGHVPNTLPRAPGARCDRRCRLTC